MNVARLLWVWLGLLALLALTIAASFAPLGQVLPVVSYTIAIAKTGLIVWFFMEMRAERGRHRIALAAGFLWAIFLFTLMAADPLSRGWFAS